MNLTINQPDDGWKEHYIERLVRWVRIPSRSAPDGGEEGAVQQEVAECLRRIGARVRLVEARDLPEFTRHPLCHGPSRNYANRPTVIAELGPAEAPALLLLAHSDTVEIPAPEKWTTDPFSGEIRDGAVYGLGVGDDKWGVAALVTVAEAVLKSGVPLRRRLTLVSTMDEENGVGNGMLILMLAGIRAQAALYLDHLYGQIGIGTMGGSALRLMSKVTALLSHKKDHAKRLGRFCQEMSVNRARLFERPGYEKNVVRDKSVFLAEKTVNGVSVFTVNFYTFPEDDRRAFGSQLEQGVTRSLGTDAEIYNLSYDEPWFEPSWTGCFPLAVDMAQAFERWTGTSAEFVISPKQDSFVLRNHAGIPTVSFGPAKPHGYGAYHQPDEHVEINAVWSCCRAVVDVVLDWMRKDE